MNKRNKWYLSDWDLNLIDDMMCDLLAGLTKFGDAYMLRTGYTNGNKNYIIWDNGGELNIFGVGFCCPNQLSSMPLPVTGSDEQTNEVVVAYRLRAWILGEEIDYTWKDGDAYYASNS